MKWWEHLIPNRRILTEIREKINEMRMAMADVSQVLNDVATGIRDNLGPRIVDVLAENAQLRNRNAELEGEDVAESAAAENVRAAFAEVAGLFDQTDEAPTPEPLPETPGEDGPAPAEQV